MKYSGVKTETNLKLSMYASHFCQLMSKLCNQMFNF